MGSGNGIGNPDGFGHGVPEEGGEGIHGVPDGTLGGYFTTHDRPPAFTGADGEPYTVSVEVERVASLAHPFVGYLVFPRWASTGLGVIGHVQSPVLLEGQLPEDIQAEMADLPLERVKELLDEAIRRTGRGTAS